jgi:hypothetical protein
MTNQIQILRSNTYGSRPAVSAQPYGAPYVNFAGKQLGVVDSTGTPQDLIGVTFFSPTANYTQGQPVNYQGQLYTAKASITAGAWNPTQWTVSTNYLPLTGGTCTGNVVVSSTSPTFVVQRNGAVNGALVGQSSSGLTRWAVVVGDVSPETGSNVGSNFSIQAYNDAGAYLYSPITINRANGGVSMWNTSIYSGGIITYTGSITSQAPNTSSNPIIVCADGNGRIPIRMYTLGVTGNAYIDNPLASTNLLLDYGGNFFYSNGSGTAYKVNGGSWAAQSDERIKTVTGNYATGLDAILKLQPVTYTYNGNDTPELPEEKTVPYKNSIHHRVASDGTKFIGLVAQQVEGHMPEMVKKINGYIDGAPVADLRTLDTSPLIFALINAVKTLNNRIAELEAKER